MPLWRRSGSARSAARLLTARGRPRTVQLQYKNDISTRALARQSRARYDAYT